MDDRAVRNLLKRKAEEKGSIAALAKDIPISYKYLLKIVHGDEPLTPAVLDYLHLERRYVYYYKEIDYE
jgi:hypothetical protein